MDIRAKEDQSPLPFARPNKKLVLMLTFLPTETSVTLHLHTFVYIFMHSAFV